RDLRWWRDRRRDRLFHKPTRRALDRHRASRGRRFRLRQIGRLSGARLVPRQLARSIGAAELRAPRRTFRRARRSLGLSASDDLGGYAFEEDTARDAPGRPWLADGVAITSRLGSPQTTALVEPRGFTTGLMHAAEAHGA